ncbi:alpha/beta hydrolase [Amycolatopsis sp. NPDC049253]|uniref:alpha/beta hydrolase n=1 Tax=Amycolatopsis sp. NPDC049253 TaxID=3155274 RepID=UPI00341F1153
MLRKSVILAVVAGAVVSLAAPASASGSTVDLGACPAEVASPELRCASVEVPLDYRHPDAAKIHVEISRLPSKDPAKRRGVLVFNPGGPGGPGLDFPLEWARAGMSTSVLAEYDLIGFDPRGIGYSTPVSCNLTDAQLPIFPKYAYDSADVTKAAAAAEQVAQQCATSKSAPLLPFLTTANTARDLDRIREALGEQKISYYGASYGTYLGGVYSTLFPSRTDRIVLDSITGPGGLDLAAARRFGEGMEQRFPDFAKWAAARNATYGLGATPAEVTATYHRLATRLDRQPLGTLDGSVFRQSSFSLVYSNSSFPTLAQLWQGLQRGEAGPLPAPEGGETDLQSQKSTMISVVCGDNAWPRSIDTYQRNVATDRVRHPLFGAGVANVWPCASWPGAPLEKPVRFSDQGPSNLLLVNNTRDPGTPLSGALETRRLFGDRARMVTVDQGGHGVWLPTLNACGYNAVTRFLVDGTRPAADTFCGAETASARQVNASQAEAVAKVQARLAE